MLLTGNNCKLAITCRDKKQCDETTSEQHPYITFLSLSIIGILHINNYSNFFVDGAIVYGLASGLGGAIILLIGLIGLSVCLCCGWHRECIRE